MRRRKQNEFRKRPPNPREVRDAQKLAKKVSPKLHDLMEADTKKNAA